MGSEVRLADFWDTDEAGDAVIAAILATVGSVVVWFLVLVESGDFWFAGLACLGVCWVSGLFLVPFVRSRWTGIGLLVAGPTAFLVEYGLAGLAFVLLHLE